MLDGEFDKISSTYEDLAALLPRVLGNTIPPGFNALGRFNMNGRAHITNESIQAVMAVSTEIGSLFFDLNLDDLDLIDSASYVGQIRFIDFNLGSAIGEPTIGLVSSSLDVVGSGFSKESISCNINGGFSSFVFQDYTYSDLQVSGVVMDKVFNGQLDTADANLKLNFSGLVDFSSSENIYDFSAIIDYANLKALKLVDRDQTSVLQGKMSVDMKGTTIDDVYA